jgi:hypothetical protein
MAWQLPAKTEYIFDRDSPPGIVNWAIQRNLNSLGESIAEDGEYGRQTANAVGRFQTSWGLGADKRFGPATSMRMAEIFGLNVILPEGLATGFVLGESSGDIGAVNHSVPGGVDVSYLMRRVYDGSDDLTIERAFDARYQFNLLARTTRQRYRRFRDFAQAHSNQISYITSARERSYRLAALAHNWPYAADRLARGYYLSSAPAPWVPQGTSFEDGTAVETFWDWARFYALGAPEHRHRGLVTRFVDDWNG